MAYIFIWHVILFTILQNLRMKMALILVTVRALVVHILLLLGGLFVHLKTNLSGQVAFILTSLSWLFVFIIGTIRVVVIVVGIATIAVFASLLVDYTTQDA